MEGALSRGSRPRLTRGREKRFWFSERGSALSGHLAERDRERQRCLHSTLSMVEKTWAVGASPGSDARSSSENERGTVSSQTRSSMGVVKARIDSRLRASQGRVAPAR
jgi:hypothetical protein